MENNSLTYFLLFFTFGLSLVSYLPQTLACFKHRDPRGIAPVSMLTGFANYVLWNVYYLYEQSHGLFLMNLATTVVYLLMLLSSFAARVDYRKAWAGPALYTGTILALFLVWPPAVGTGLLCGAAWYFATAVLKAVRADTITGLSPGTWYFMLVYGLTYSAMGLLGAPWAAWVWGLMAAVASVTMLVLIHRKGRALNVPLNHTGVI